MEKADIRELRKAVKARDNIVDWVYGFYVDADNNTVWDQVMRLADMEDAERFRHVAMFQRVLSTRIGRDTFSVALTEQNEALLALRSTDSGDTAALEAFRDAFTAGYTHTDPYYATLTRIVYDVPLKGTDGRKLEDGDVVYEALLLAVCPAKLTRAALGFREDRVAELDRRWQIGNPVAGFLYPSFSERLEDRNEVMLRSNAPDGEDFLTALFAVQAEAAPVGAETQRALFSDLLGQMDVNLESAAAISENLVEKAAEEDAPQTLEKQTVRKIAEAAGAPMEDFDEIYDETIGDTQIALDAVAESCITVKTDAMTLKVPIDKAQLIRTRIIDGREYILIPADGTVTVNGTAVSASAGERAASAEADTGMEKAPEADRSSAADGSPEGAPWEN